jgi:predicted protein tyrosine phosphatase
MKVTVLNKTNFDALMLGNYITDENVEQRKDLCFISINGTISITEKPWFSSSKKNVIVLFFDDVDVDAEIPILGTGKTELNKAFTEQQAKEVIDFLEQNKDKKQCFVHCAAGYSRSGAVGAFANDYFGGNWFEFKNNNPAIKPNGHVMVMLNRELRNHEGEI